MTPQDRFLEGVEPRRFLDEILHGGLRNPRPRVLQEGADDVLAAGLDQGVGYVHGDGVPDGDGHLMFKGAMADGLDELRVLQYLALGEDRIGDLDIIVGQYHGEFGRRVR